MENKKLRRILSVILTVLMLLDFDSSSIFGGSDYIRAGEDTPAPTDIVETVGPEADGTQNLPGNPTAVPGKTLIPLPSPSPEAGLELLPTAAPTDKPAAEPSIRTASSIPSFERGYAKTVSGNVRVYTRERHGLIFTRLKADSIVYVDAREPLINRV